MFQIGTFGLLVCNNHFILLLSIFDSSQISPIDQLKRHFDFVFFFKIGPKPSRQAARGASQPKSVVACSKMKIRKDPYCVDFRLGFTPHSTQFWATPHTFSVDGVTHKVPIPHISSTFCKYCCRTWAFFARKHPIPHTFCVIFDYIPISHPI